jgi:hypothetical protein
VGKQKQKKWESKGFDYENVSFLVKVVGLKADEYDLTEWIRDSKKIKITDLPSKNLLALKEEFFVAKSQNKVIFKLRGKMDNTDITDRLGWFCFEAEKWITWTHKGEKDYKEDEYKGGKKLELKISKKASLIKSEDIKHLLLNNTDKKILISSFGVFEFNKVGQYNNERQITINEPFSISIYEND